jgi:hypothetical protein
VFVEQSGAALHRERIVRSDAVPAVASEPPRWNASCRTTNAPPWAASTVAKQRAQGPQFDTGLRWAFGK